MIVLDEAETAALAGRVIVPRWLISVWPASRETGERQFFGFWNGGETRQLDVIDPVTGLLDETRTFEAGGNLIGIEGVRLAAMVSIRDLVISLSQISAALDQAFKAYDPHQAPLELHRVLLDAETRQPVFAGRPRWRGRVDDVSIPVAAEGQSAPARITVGSATRELTRTNPATRSDESHRARRSDDRFYRYAAVEAPVYWGEEHEPKKSIGQTLIDGFNDFKKKN